MLPETSSSLSASVSPLTPIGHPGHDSHHSLLSCQAARSPKYKGQTQALSVLWSASLILLSARRAAGEGGARLQVGVLLFPLLPRIHTLCWPAAPSSVRRGSCPDQSRPSRPISNLSHPRGVKYWKYQIRTSLPCPRGGKGCNFMSLAPSY